MSLLVTEVRDFETYAVQTLRQQGLRITTPRMLVIRALAGSDRALTPYAIHERIADQGGRIDVVSVYRILTALAEVGLVHRIGVLDGFAACRQGKEHHDRVQHLVCSECGSVEEMEIGAEVHAGLYERAKASQFDAVELHVELVGVCATCRGNG